MDPYDFIRTAIIEGDYEPGKRLTEEFLSSELNVSRTPIREAIRRLEADGLVTTLKRGVSVKHFSDLEVRQIYDLRAVLEGYAAGQAALVKTHEDINDFKHLNDNMDKIMEESGMAEVSQYAQAILEANNQLHEVILLTCKNDLLRLLISKLIVLPLVFRSYLWRERQDIMRSIDEHRIIIGAIDDGDPYRAQTAMAEHIFRGRDYVLKNLPKLRRQLAD